MQHVCLNLRDVRTERCPEHRDNERCLLSCEEPHGRRLERTRGFTVREQQSISPRHTHTPTTRLRRLAPLMVCTCRTLRNGCDTVPPHRRARRPSCSELPRARSAADAPGPDRGERGKGGRDLVPLGIVASRMQDAGLIPSHGRTWHFARYQFVAKGGRAHDSDVLPDALGFHSGPARRHEGLVTGSASVFRGERAARS